MTQTHRGGRAAHISRRTALAGGVAAVAALRNRSASAAAAQPTTTVSFEVPANACDCHTHIHADTTLFPWFAGRVYTPELASPEEMAALHEKLHLQRVVIVTPSVYGTNNAATAFGIKARGAHARGVAVIDDKTTDAQLDELGKAGFVGVRLNLATGGISDPNVGRERLKVAIKRLAARGWHVQIYTDLAMITATKDLVMASPVPVVFDHFGGARGKLGVEQPGFKDLLELVQSGKAYVKISGAYRSSTEAAPFADVAPLAKALIAANDSRVVWGTDWPHPNSSPPKGQPLAQVTPLYQIDDGLLMNQLAVWAPNAATRAKILVANPAVLYKF